MQLVAYGAQDIYLTGNPQITFFKVVYRRHTNFSMEAIQQTWNGSSTAGRCTATISRNGDLVYRMYFEIDHTTADTGADNPGAGWITDVELEIGGQKIDKHTGLWMECWAELTEPNSSGTTLAADTSLSSGTLFQKMSLMGGVNTAGQIIDQKSFVPLQFWFCRNPGLALPLIALQYHEVKVILNHTFNTNFTVGDQKLWCDYIYLDTDERRRFAQVSHEYLIEQVQEGSLTTGTGELNFNHPVKELVWTASTKLLSGGEAASVPLTGTYILKLNGHDRFAARDFRYFSRTQVWEHHSGAGGLDSSSTASAGKFDDSIGVYSFALKPEEHQPSGTCNFSRIDNARLESTGAAAIDKIFAVNYNVLRIMSGMGGLAYSN
jgi:hypothetical protein